MLAPKMSWSPDHPPSAPTPTRALAERDPRFAIVTTPKGRLVGVARRDDLG
jgi:hypothetical protein